MKDEIIILIRKWFKSKTGIGLIHDPSLISLVNEIEALRIHDVVGRSEQLKAFMDFAEFAKEEYGLHIPINLIKEYVKSL